jgi:hypothetical protein
MGHFGIGKLFRGLNVPSEGHVREEEDTCNS